MLFDCPRVTNIFTPSGGKIFLHTKGGTDIFRLKGGANIFRLKGGSNIFTQGGGTFSIVSNGDDNDVYGEKVVSKTNIPASKPSKLSAGARILRGL